MDITKIKIILPGKIQGKIKAFADITIDDCFIIRGLKVIDGNEGYFVAMPSRKSKTGQIVDTAHPIKNDTRMMIENAILDKYEAELNR